MSYPPAWTKDTDIYAVRSLFAKLAAVDTRLPHVLEEDYVVKARDGTNIAVRVYRPRNDEVSREGRPAMLVIHGGGFCVGGLESGARQSRFFAERTGGVAVNVEYRLAPEFPFPTAIYDAYDALEWVVSHTDTLGIDPARGLLIAGESAGADLALATAYLWADGKKTPRLTGVFSAAASSASLDTVPDRFKSQFVSIYEHANAPVMGAETIDFIKSLYKPDANSPLAYIVAVPDPSIMPKTYFQACGVDPLRDCTLILAEVWREAGVSTKIDLYPTMPHVFWVLGLDNDETKTHERDSEEGLRWLLT